MSKQSTSASEMRLFTNDNRRLYLNQSERASFIRTAAAAPTEMRLFCLTLAYTGCRLSEARYLRREDLQLDECLICFQTLKRRKSGQTREVPIPSQLVDEFQTACSEGHIGCEGYLFSRGTCPPARILAYRWVKRVMNWAEVSGPQACPKGLRHGFGVHATLCGIQLHMLQKWMGHAAMETTAIYATASGPEEQRIVMKMW